MTRPVWHDVDLYVPSSADDIRAWNHEWVSNFSEKDKKSAYFRWHYKTKLFCVQHNVQMPVRPKRAKAESEKERKQRVDEQNARTRVKRKIIDRTRHSTYFVINKEKIKERKHRYALNNYDKIKQQRRQWRTNNKEKILAYSKMPSAVAAQKARHKQKMAKDLNYRLTRYLRKTIHWAIKAYGRGKGRKSASTASLMGCSLDYFMAHIEYLWTDDMSWDNYGKRGWHIDHKKPCASFDLSDEKQQRECFHYTNLQPLWAFDNHSKGASLTWTPAMKEAA